MEDDERRPKEDRWVSVVSTAHEPGVRFLQAGRREYDRRMAVERVVRQLGGLLVLLHQRRRRLLQSVRHRQTL